MINVVQGAVAPAITTHPVSKTINSGGTTTLTVAASGTPAPTFKWYRGPKGDTTTLVSGSSTSASFTTPVLVANATYWALATNSAGSAQSNAATVTVVTPPAITTQPVSVTINSGGTTTLTVAASGTSPTFQWYQGPKGDTMNLVSGASTSASFTTPALAVDATYWALATNAAGNSQSNAATVTVITPPAITTQPASVSIDSGSTATLTVAASGTSPTFQWYIGNSGDLSTPVSGATLASFTTPALTTATSYWVRATNVANTADSNTATVSMNATSGTIQNWGATQFSPAQQADPLISGPTADPDGDGMTNEMEYVFGLSPLSSERSPETTLAVTSGNLSVAFTAKSASGEGYAGRVRHYAIETKPDLFSSAWSSPPGYSDIIASDQSVNYSAATAGPKQFCRLRVWFEVSEISGPRAKQIRSYESEVQEEIHKGVQRSGCRPS